MSRLRGSSRTPRLLLRILAGEFLVRSLAGAVGLFFPSQGAPIQVTLLMWGSIACIMLLAMLLREPPHFAFPTISAILLLGAGVVLRLPDDADLAASFFTLVSVWLRLILPIASATLFVRYARDCADMAAIFFGNRRARRATAFVGMAIAGVLVVRLAAGYAWSWSPQQPIPYLALAALGASGAGSIGGYALSATIVALSLKRSAMVAFLVMIAMVLRPRGVRSLDRVPVVIFWLISAVVAIFLVTRSPIGLTLEHRLEAGAEQIREILLTDAATNTSVGIRVAETEAVTDAWMQNAATILLGAELNRLEIEDRDFLTVHNTGLAALHLGGVVYAGIAILTILRSRRGWSGPVAVRQRRWYAGAAVAGIVESLAGNAMLTVTMGASLAALYVSAISAERAHDPVWPHAPSRAGQEGRRRAR